MTTFTLKDLSTSKTEMRFFKSLDKLKLFLSGVLVNKSKLKQTKVIENGKEYEILGVSYDQNDDSIPLLQRYGIIPKDDEYGS